MPEGDTVWLAARRLHAALTGHRLTRSDFRVPQLATVDLIGRTIVGTVSRGKHLLTRVEDDLTLHTHFRMDGSWHLYRHGARWTGGPAWEVRVLLETAGWQAVGYRLPVVELLARGDEASAVGHLGPDLLGPDWDHDEAVRRLSARPEREIGDALLDQRNLAGIGNLYKAECLYLSGTSPWTPVGEVPDLGAVISRARRLLLANRDHPWHVTTGVNRRGREHWVFERSGRPCRRCGTVIKSGRQGRPPFDRVTYWCPTCQDT
ncbi:MAG: DNA-formamidopyrimidine glycosylase family protein [Actinomycetes bacterium]